MKRAKPPYFLAKDMRDLIRGPGGRAIIADMPNDRVLISDARILLLLDQRYVCPTVARGNWHEAVKGTPCYRGALPDDLDKYASVGVGDTRLERHRIFDHEYRLQIYNLGDCAVWEAGGIKYCIQERYTKIAQRFGMSPWTPDPLVSFSGRPASEGALLNTLPIPLSIDGKTLSGIVMPVPLNREEP